MPLVDTEIKRALDSGAWKAYRDGEPIGFDDLTVGPNSVDVTLGGVILEVCKSAKFVNPRRSKSISEKEIRPGYANGGFALRPGNLYLASVRESFDCSAPLHIEEQHDREIEPDIWTFQTLRAKKYFAPMIDGRSTLARVGLSVHNTAGFGDYGFDGQFTLEISCLLPIVLYPGMRIAQVSFHALTGTPTQRYSGAYTKQTGPQPAVLGEGRI